jgi:UDP-N-acetylmuramoylalanine--D-glutamate ligase
VRVLIYGLGRSGLAAGTLCLQQGHEVTFFDRRELGTDIDTLLTLGGRRVAAAAVEPADLCIAAPGVPIDHPDLVALRAAGVATIGEVEWVFRTVGAPSIGVTGTAGKGTTTRWIHDLLKAAGVDAVLGGNYDPALAAVARPGATAVIEFSSFQLERCPSYRPDVAVVLNLGADHLDRHGSVERYHATKRELIAHLTPRDVLVYNADDPVARNWAQATPAEPRSFSLEREADGHLDPDGALVLDGEPLVEAGAMALSGRHNVANGLAAALAAQARGVERSVLAEGLTAYRGLPGRYAPAGSIGDIRFVDDSIATRPLAVAAALDASEAPVVWIAGGVDKGADLQSLEGSVRSKVSLMIGIGDAGPGYAEAASAWVPTTLCPEVDGRAALGCAVAAAVEHLREHHRGRGTVLLAPLAASFDQFVDYAERGAVFRAVVQGWSG